jgi:hypothetical protein
MNEQPPTETIEPCAFAKRTMVLAVVIAGLSLFLPGILWRTGRWGIIFSGSGVLCAASFTALLLSIRAIRRWRRGPTSYVAVVISGLALLFWCSLILAFIGLSLGGSE